MLSIEEIKLLIEKLENVKKEDLQKLIDSNLKILKDLASAVDANNNEEINRLDKTAEWFKTDNEKKKEKPVVDLFLYKIIQTKTKPKLLAAFTQAFGKAVHIQSLCKMIQPATPPQTSP